MSERLDELKRQKELMVRHLRWLEEELDREARKGVVPPERLPAAVHRMERDAVTEIPELPHPVRGISSGQRLGCIVFAILLMAGLSAMIWILPMWIYD